MSGRRAIKVPALAGSRNLAFLLAGTILALSLAAPAAGQQRPNVVLIIADDMNDWVGVLGGHAQTETPNIDALAAEGTLFSNAHAAAPLCNPSRLSFMTGMSPARTGIKNNQWQPWREHVPDAVPLNEAFRAAGYYTIGLGKIYHGGPDNNDRNNWDYYTPIPPSAEPPAGDIPINGFDQITRGGPGAGDWGIVDAPASEFEDHIIATWAEDYLNNRAPGDTQPFFLAVGLRSSHSPWYFPQEYFDRIAGGDTSNILPPPSIGNDLDDVGPVARNWASPGLWSPIVDDSAAVQFAVHSYLAAIAFADDQVGRVLAALEANGFEDDTIVVFVSDHGYHLSEKRAWQKQLLWEEDSHVPLIFRLPPGMVAAAAGQVDEPVSISAIFPTLLEMAGVPAPDYAPGDPLYRVDYRSLSPLLDLSADPKWHGPAVMYGRGEDVTLRTSDYRFTQYNDGFVEFYDHLTDPEEWFNVAGSAPYSALIPQLASDGERYLATRHAPFGHSETCGPADLDPVAAPGVHVWKDCDEEGHQAWRLRIVAGSSGALEVYSGAIESADTFSNVTGFQLEADDSLNDDIEFVFNAANSGTDGVDFDVPNGADACLSFSSMPSGARIYVGSTGFPAAAPLNLRTLEYCGGSRGTGRMGDFVWADADGDGTQDGAESGYRGAEVRLLDCATSNEIASTTTNLDGSFLFKHVPAGSFQLMFIRPPGYALSPTGSPAGGGLDSNADPATGLTDCFSMSAGQSRLGIDAGLVYTGVITPPSLSVSNASVAEDSGSLVFNVTLSGTTSSEVRFSAATVDGTATVGDADYTALASASGSIPPGQVSTTVIVPVSADSTQEPDETMTLQLSNISANVTVVDAVAVGTILNDDTVPSLPAVSIADASANEDTGILTFTVSITQPAGSDIAFTASTGNGSATLADADYSALVNQAGTIRAGDLSTTVSVSLGVDSIVESDETFTVALSGVSSNAAFGDAFAVGTIVNDDSNGGGAVPVTTWSASQRGVSTSGNVITFAGTPTGWWNNTVTSRPLSELGFTDDFEVRFTLESDPAGSVWIVGLGITETDWQWQDVDFGLRSGGGQLTIYEAGSWRTSASNMSAGDVLSIYVNNGTLEYRHNGAVVYTSSYSGSPDFYIDTAFKEGAIAMSVEVEGAMEPVNPPDEAPITVWTSVTGGVSVNGSSLSHSGAPNNWTNSANSAPLSNVGADDEFTVSWTVASPVVGTTWVVGLGVEETGPDWRDVDFGMRSSEGVLNIRLSGIWVAQSRMLVPGDRLSIRVSGTTIEFQLNGAPIATSTRSGTESFYIDTAFKNGAITLGDFTLTQ